jgi:general secretion pathway protein K
MPRSERGFALLIVVIALAALSLIFAAAIATTRQHLSDTTMSLARVRLSAAVDGALTTVAYELATAREIPPRALGAPQIVAIGGVPVEVSLRPEAAKLDLNTAAPSLLYRYFLVSGLSQQSAQQLVGAILERRQKSDAAYAKAHDIKPGVPFDAVSEIFAIQGVTDDIGACTGPDLTVFTGLAGVDPALASPRVREADGLTAHADATPPAGAVASGRAVVAGEIFEVTARARDDANGVRLSRQTVLRVTGDARTPIWTLAVTTPAPDPKAAQAACDRLQQNAQAQSADASLH